MASRIRFSALAASTLVASVEFNSLADEGNAAGSLVAASSYGQMYADWFISASYTSAPSGHVELYFVSYFGGSPTDGGSAIDPPANSLVGSFALREATGRQLIPMNFLMMPNRDFIPTLINRGNVTMGAGSNFLYFQPYDVNPDA
jgi:hypothetical protein